MDEKDLHAIALFFYYAFLNDWMARLACLEAVKLAERRVKTAEPSSKETQIARVCYEVFEIYKKKQRHLSPKDHQQAEMIWKSPEELPLAPWRDLLKKGADEEVACLILAHIVNFSENSVAEALGLTVGSLRYRLGRALKLLGAGHLTNFKETTV